MLTREQVEAFRSLVNFDQHTIKVEGGYCGVHSALAMMIDTDADLRAKVEEVTLRRSETIAMCDQLRAEIDRLRGERTDDQLHTDNIELRVRCEAAERERDAARDQQAHNASCVLALLRQLDVAKGNLPNNHVV